MKLSATVQAVSAFGICAAIAVSAVYVTKSAAQSAKERQPKAGTNAAPIYGVTIPAGYRDWHLIAVSRLVGGKSDNMAVFEGHMAHNQLRALLGNDIAAKAFREGKRPFPDGAMIAALHWNEGSSDENDKVLAMGFPGAGLQSSVPESAVNVQFMVKNLKNTRRRPVGDLPTSPTANPAARRCTKLAGPAISPPRTATSSSRATRLHHEISRAGETLARPRDTPRISLRSSGLRLLFKRTPRALGSKGEAHRCGQPLPF